jgi:succinate dehydrogenase cytochrome b subunit
MTCSVMPSGATNPPERSLRPGLSDSNEMNSNARTLTLFDATIGKKAIVAVTGLVLFGFVIAHMLGNLQVFLGPEAMNGYAETLRQMPFHLLWVARLVLLVSVVLHIVFSIRLVLESNQARPVGYRAKQSAATSYAARTMKFSGPLLALFIVYHLAHFTWPGVAMAAYQHDPHDVYSNFVNGFRVPWVTAVYLVAQVMLGLHLYHGAWSLFQTLGLNHPRYNGLREALPRALAFLVVTGNVIMPIAVLVGIIR